MENLSDERFYCLGQDFFDYVNFLTWVRKRGRRDIFLSFLCSCLPSALDLYLYLNRKRFCEKAGYDELDKRIALSKSRKDSLLLVLKYPELPLHNNASELGARAQARKRDINLHTMSSKGTEAKDTLMTIVETAKKHEVNIYHYLYDRITQKYEMPSLANLIKLACVSDQKAHNAALSHAKAS